MNETSSTIREIAPHLRFAVIGCGALARSQHIPNIARFQRIVLYACVDLDETVLAECREHRLGALQTRNGYEGATSDPEVDAICLATAASMKESFTTGRAVTL